MLRVQLARTKRPKARLGGPEPRSRIHGLVITLLIGSLATAGSAQAQGSRSLEIAVPAEKSSKRGDANLRHWMEVLAGEGIAVNRCGLDTLRGSFVLDLEDETQLTELQARGFTVIREFDSPPLHSRRTQSEYLSPGEIQAALQQIHSDHPGITRLFAVGTTFEGRDIHGIEISDQPGASEDEPALLFNGQHHPREVATSHVALDVANTLTDGYGTDATLTGWVTDFKTVVVPMVNPDGTQHVFDVDALWRKNRQTYPGGCLGVDLNRNYPYRWGPAGCGFLGSCATSTYPGPNAASELETQAMIALAEAWDFTLAVSYHAFGRFIDYPYACSTGAGAELMPEHVVVDEIMNGMADAIDAVDSVPRYGVFSPASAGPLSGDDTSWYYAHLGTYAMVVEVGTSFEPTFSQVPGIVERNRGGWKHLYHRLSQARIDAHITDGQTGQPLEANVRLAEFNYDSGELPRTTAMPFGRWTYLVPAGTSYTLHASADGYQDGQVNVSVGSTPVALNLALLPVSAIPSLPARALAFLALFLGIGAHRLLRASRQAPGRTHDA